MVEFKANNRCMNFFLNMAKTEVTEITKVHGWLVIGNRIERQRIKIRQLMNAEKGNQYLPWRVLPY